MVTRSDPTPVLLAPGSRPRLLLTIPEARDQLGISHAHIYRLMASGELRSIKLGRSRRIRYEDLVGFLTRLADESEAPGPAVAR